MASIYSQPRKSGGVSLRTVISKERSPDGKTTYAYLDGEDATAEALAAGVASDPAWPTRSIKHAGWEKWAAAATLVEVSDAVAEPLAEAEEANETVADSVESETAAAAVEDSTPETDSLEGIDFDGSGAATEPSSEPAVGDVVTAVTGYRTITGRIVSLSGVRCTVHVRRMRVGRVPMSVASGTRVEVLLSEIQ